MKRKHITAAVLSALLVASSAVTAFAAPYDFFQVSLSKTHSILDVATKTSVVLDVATKPSDFTIELKDGKKYPLADYIKVMKDNPTFTEDQAIEELNKMGLKVVSVSAISPKAIKVAFSKPVNDEDKAKLAFDITATPAVTQKWADDKMSVELERAANFPEGKYTVNVKFDGKELAKEELEFKAVAPAKVVINDDVIAKNAAAALDVQILDQYGEANGATGTGFVVNKTEPGRTVTQGVNYKVYNTSNCEIGDELEITVVVNSDPTIKATKMVKVGYPVGKDLSVEFGEIKFAEDKTEINPSDTFKIPVTVKKNGKVVEPDNDQNAIALGSSLGGVGNAFVADGEKLKVFFDDPSIATVNYKKAEKAFEITLEATAKPGNYEFKIIDNKANVYAVSYTVAASPAPAELLLAEEPAFSSPVELQVNATKKFKFKILMSNGKEAKDADIPADYKIKVTKDSNADALVETKAGGALANHNAEIPKADLLKTMELKALAAGVGKSESITYQLLDNKDKPVGNPVLIRVDIIAEVAAIEAKTDKTEYKSGEEINLEVSLLDAASNLLPYTLDFENVAVSVGTTSPDSYLIPVVNFKNGKGKITVLAKTHFNNEKVKVTLPGGAIFDETDAVSVTEGELALFKVSKGADQKEIKIEAQDASKTKKAGFNETIILTIKATKEGIEHPLDELTYPATNQHSATFTNGDVAAFAVSTTDIPVGAKVTVEYIQGGKTVASGSFIMN